MPKAKSRWEDLINRKFSYEGERPRVRTVGDLKAVLDELPDDLPVAAGWAADAGQAEAAVYNVSSDDAFFTLGENDC